MNLQFDVYAKIARPVEEVFDAVVNPKKLSAYFATGGASGPIAEGATVTWKFGDYPHAIPVKVTKVVPNERIEFGWEANEGGYDTQVVMTFERLDGGRTLVRIAEGGWRENAAGLKSSYDNCGGWTQMLACLKAWAEHGIQLRQGYF